MKGASIAGPQAISQASRTLQGAPGSFPWVSFIAADLIPPLTDISKPMDRSGKSYSGNPWKSQCLDNTVFSGCYSFKKTLPIISPSILFCLAHESHGSCTGTARRTQIKQDFEVPWVFSSQISIDLRCYPMHHHHDHMSPYLVVRTARVEVFRPSLVSRGALRIPARGGLHPPTHNLDPCPSHAL